MTEVMEKIDKDESEEELINAYDFSIVSINFIEEWEIEKANLPARKIQTAKFNAKVRGGKMEKAELETRVQDLEKEKDNHQERYNESIVKLKEFKGNFTRFINSRQQGHNPSEGIAIGLIGFALVVLMHLGFPERVAGVGAFSVHLFTLFTSTIVVFLFFRIRDLEKDRRRPLHDVVPGYFHPDYFGSDFLGPDLSSELWKGPIHRIYRSPDRKWIFAISVVTTMVYVLLLWIVERAYSPHL